MTTVIGKVESRLKEKYAEFRHILDNACTQPNDNRIPRQEYDNLLQEMEADYLHLRDDVAAYVGDIQENHLTEFTNKWMSRLPTDVFYDTRSLQEVIDDINWVNENKTTFHQVFTSELHRAEQLLGTGGDTAYLLYHNEVYPNMVKILQDFEYYVNLVAQGVGGKHDVSHPDKTWTETFSQYLKGEVDRLTRVM